MLEKYGSDVWKATWFKYKMQDSKEISLINDVSMISLLRFISTLITIFKTDKVHFARLLKWKQRYQHDQDNFWSWCNTF